MHAFFRRKNSLWLFNDVLSYAHPSVNISVWHLCTFCGQLKSGQDNPNTLQNDAFLTLIERYIFPKCNRCKSKIKTAMTCWVMAVLILLRGISNRINLLDDTL